MHTIDAAIRSVKDKSEWHGTDVVFDIAPRGVKTSRPARETRWLQRSSADTGSRWQNVEEISGGRVLLTYGIY